MSLPIYVIGQLIIILLTIGLLSSIYVGLNKIAPTSNINNKQKESRTVHYTMTLIMGWLLLLLLLSLFGYFTDPKNLLRILLAIFFIPTLVFIFIAQVPHFKTLLAATDGRWLIRIQGFRIITELLYWLGYKAGFVPPQMTFHWLNYDIIVGLSALLASQVFFMGKTRKLEILLWNTFGLISVLYIVTISFASLPDTDFQLFRTFTNSQFITEIPYIWIIGFAYPFAIAMHIYSIRQAFTFTFSEKVTFKKLSDRMNRLN